MRFARNIVDTEVLLSSTRSLTLPTYTDLVSASCFSSGEGKLPTGHRRETLLMFGATDLREDEH